MNVLIRTEIKMTILKYKQTILLTVALSLKPRTQRLSDSDVWGKLFILIMVSTEKIHFQRKREERSSVSSTEKDIDMRLTKAWTAIDKLSVKWKSDLTDKIKRSFFQAAVVSILLYGCTTWTLTKRLEKRLDGNFTGMLRAILNKSWRQHPTKHQLYGHMPPIRKTIQVRGTRHAGHYWRSRDELISIVPLWSPIYGWAKAGRPAGTYIQLLCEDTGWSPKDLPEAMNDREKWRERVGDIRESGMTWWWWRWWWNMVSRGVLERHVRCWDQGATWNV